MEEIVTPRHFKPLQTSKPTAELYEEPAIGMSGDDLAADIREPAIVSMTPNEK